MTRVTLRDVAARAGVSTAAISQALNGRGNLSAETRERIKAVAAELGYAPNKHASALRSGRTMSIGFVMAANSLQDGRRALQRARQLDALVQAGAERGFTVTVLPDSRPDLLAGAQIDALYFPDPADDRTILRDAVAAGIPVAANDLTVPGGVLTIRTGYAAAVRAGLAHLAEAGAQRIGFLVDESEVPRDQLGESAYLAWSAVNGRTPLVARLDAGRRRLVPALHELLDTDVDAVFAYCEEGPEIYLHLEQIDTVMPRDLQLLVLCTIDCEMNARLGITHLCLHPEKAPEGMFAALDAGDPPRAIELPYELVRGSTTR
ncbi:LacI family DNA-binding transcriptional regulator [Microbacterium laevaniformans]|uniref:Lactose operon repressor n=1 Tax=Microbacterium laevaniformans TaxID=36807 RepID=A0A150HFS1_9MICO|nr:LacI family DNA-binding transcriptional regulator [Microbacterium laevaniformans]KXZ60470.1 Lactose operon repressor [Microbacterium laevaniformans]MBM7752987.1 LacI family transcriptional regulator [Microbacterium laevaniformans]GLJ64486.1 LacI family transcriptional regulator [Microbacterium laevaniformans]